MLTQIMGLNVSDELLNKDDPKNAENGENVCRSLYGCCNNKKN